MKRFLLLLLLTGLLHSCRPSSPDVVTQETWVVVSNGTDRYERDYVIFAAPSGDRAILQNINKDLYPVGKVVPCYVIR